VVKELLITLFKFDSKRATMSDNFYLGEDFPPKPIFSNISIRKSRLTLSKPFHDPTPGTNGVDPRFKILIRVGAIAMIWSLMLCRNNKVFNDTRAFFAGYLPVYGYTPFLVTFTSFGVSRPFYGGLYTVEGHGEGHFFPAWVA
jgi:hypothetical protein